MPSGEDDMGGGNDAPLLGSEAPLFAGGRDAPLFIGGGTPNVLGSVGVSGHDDASGIDACTGR